MEGMYVYMCLHGCVLHEDWLFSLENLGSMCFSFSEEHGPGGCRAVANELMKYSFALCSSSMQIWPLPRSKHLAGILSLSKQLR
jgi:hypothetical protein